MIPCSFHGEGLPGAPAWSHPDSWTIWFRMLWTCFGSEEAARGSS